MMGEGQEQHRLLKRLVGDWNVEAPSPDPAAAPGEMMKGTEAVRAVGDYWVVCEGRMPMADGSLAVSVMTLGFDAATGRVTGTWIGSMMGHLWIYDGTIDEAADTLTLASEGPTFDGSGGTAHYEDIMAFDGEDARTLTSRMRQPDGSWKELFVVRYRRSF